MKITILTDGSRGDIQSFLPLPRGLMGRGHQVILVAPARFENLIIEHGIQFARLTGDPDDLSRRLNHAGHSFIKMILELMSHAIEIGSQVFRQTEKACKDADLIINTFTHAVGAYTLAREKNNPDIHTQLFPIFTSTGNYPNITLPDFKIRMLNRLSHQISAMIAGWGAKRGFEQVCHRAGLPKRKLFWPFEVNPPRLRLRSCVRGVQAFSHL